MVLSTGTIIKITALTVEEGFKVQINSLSEIQNCTWNITDTNGNVCIKGETRPHSSVAEICGVFDATEWAPEHPVLYTFNADIQTADSKEQISDRFGFRRFSCDEKHIYLNGYPFYMRAYIRGAAAHEHQNNCGLSEHEFYKKNILAAKSYGFNTIRFHSVVPPRECFEMADELGMLIHIETRPEKSKNYNNLEEMLYGLDNLITNEGIEKIIDRLYNHPSLMVYCIGNELRHPGVNPRIREIGEFIRKKDPTRLFIDTCAHGEYDRDTVDFDVQHMGYFFPYGKHNDMFDSTENLLCFGNVGDCEMISQEGENKIRRTISFNRPLVAHEVCHYTAWRDFYALKEKFEKYGKPAPWWVDQEIEMIEAKGYKDNFPQILQVTKNFQFRCWKTALEGIRRSNILSGFHMLQFADTDKYENSNGVVDCFDDRQGISAEEFRKFNADTVILSKLDGNIYKSGEKVKIPVILSQYMISPPKKAEFTYTLTADSKVLSKGTLTSVDTAKSGTYEICTIELVLPKTETSQKLTLGFRLDFCDGTACDNTWDIWVFADITEKLVVDAMCRMDKDYLNDAVSFSSNENYVVTDCLDDQMMNDLENGKNVMLIYRTAWTRHLLDKTMKAPQYSFRHTWERFKGVIWDRGTINGGIDNKQLLNKYGFATDGEIDFQYYPLIDDCDKINLDDFPVKVNSIISGIDKSNRDRFDPKSFNLPDLMHDRTMRNFTYAFEVKVGKGKLLVTGLNFTLIKQNNPASLAMFKALTSYFTSEEFNPEAEISVSDFRKYLSDVALSGPQKERMMTQYWQLDSEPVESMEYWTESRRYLEEDM
ncbi:MAG: hypothetical protein IJO74_04405 [Clostridia bacterium]|nr:hypothetical protein [Clostridia bacterium]